MKGMSGWADSLPFLRYLTTALEHLNDAVMLVEVEDEDAFRLLLANQAFHDMSGFPPDSVGRRINEFLGTEDHEHALKWFRQVVKTKVPVTYTQWTKVPLGHRAFEVQMIPVLNAVEQVVQVILVARDITELLELRGELQTLRAARRLPL
jgi:PAS domain S-box-containing protein